MTQPALALTLAANLATGLVAGLLIGAVYFASLRWSMRLLTTGHAARAIAVQIARFAMAGITLTTLAVLGAPELVGGALGVLLARGQLLSPFGEPK